MTITTHCVLSVLLPCPVLALPFLILSSSWHATSLPPTMGGSSNRGMKRKSPPSLDLTDEGVMTVTGASLTKSSGDALVDNLLSLVPSVEVDHSAVEAALAAGKSFSLSETRDAQLEVAEVGATSNSFFSFFGIVSNTSYFDVVIAAGESCRRALGYKSIAEFALDKAPTGKAKASLSRIKRKAKMDVANKSLKATGVSSPGGSAHRAATKSGNLETTSEEVATKDNDDLDEDVDEDVEWDDDVWHGKWSNAPWNNLPRMERKKRDELKKIYELNRDAFLRSDIGANQCENSQLLFESFMVHVNNCRRSFLFGQAIWNCKICDIIHGLYQYVFPQGTCESRTDLRLRIEEYTETLTAGVTRRLDKIKGRDQQVSTEQSEYKLRKRRQIRKIDPEDAYEMDHMKEIANSKEDSAYNGASVDLTSKLNRTNIKKYAKAEKKAAPVKVGGKATKAQRRSKKRKHDPKSKGLSQSNKKFKNNKKKKKKKRTSPRGAPVNDGVGDDNQPELVDDVYGCPRQCKLDDQILFKEDTDQYIVFERLFPGENGSAGHSYEQDVNVTKGYLAIHASAATAYLFADGRRTYHGEYTYEQVLGLQKFAHQHGKEFYVIPNKDDHTEHTFLKALHYGSDAYDKHFGDLEIDAEWMVRTLLRLREDKDEAVYKKDTMNGTDVRNTIHFDGGFGSQTNDMNQEERDTVVPFPVLIHQGKPVYDRLYQAVGDTMDCLMDFLQEHGTAPDGTKAYHDDNRFELGGKKLRDKCNGNRSRQEAFTLGATIVGEFRNGKLVMQKEHKVGRHSDGPNDERPGYSFVAVFSVLVLVDDKVYRLSIITYSRHLIGCQCEKENDYMQPFLQAINEYEANRCGGLKYQDFSLIHPSLEFKDDVPLFNKTNRKTRVESQEEAAKNYEHDDEDDDSIPGMEAVMVDPEAAKTVHKKATLDGVAFHPSFVCRSGYESIYPWMIERLIEKYGLRRRKVIELHYLAMLCNNALVFYFIVSKWLNEDPIDPAECFVTRYYRDCCKHGFEPGSGKNPRFTSTCNVWPGIWKKCWKRSKQEAKAELVTALDWLEKILAAAETERDPNVILDWILDKKLGVPKIGEVCVLSFYTLGVSIGLLISDTAVRNSFHARIAPGSPSGKFLEERGCDEKGLEKVLLQISEARDEYVCDSENGGCKTFRKLRCSDGFIRGMVLFDRQVVEGVAGLYRMEPGTTCWTKFTPRFDLSK